MVIVEFGHRQIGASLAKRTIEYMVCNCIAYSCHWSDRGHWYMNHPKIYAMVGFIP